MISVVDGEEKAKPPLQRVLGTLRDLLPTVQLIFTLIVAIYFFLLNNQTTSFSQTSKLNTHDQQISALRNDFEKMQEDERRKDKEMLTRELFEAYHKNDVERMDRLERLLQQLLERPVR